jgi:hypothetical protein
MKTLQPNTLDREQVINMIAHEILHRLLKIEPECLVLDYEEGGTLFTTTDEGKFLSDLLDTLDRMRTDSKH